MSVLNRFLLFAFVCAGSALQVFAQDPPPETQDLQADPAQQQRIVDGRPALYSVKRGINPLTWMDTGMRPFFRIAETDRVKALFVRRPGKVRVGLGGAGNGSGFGPVVSFVDEDLFGKGIKLETPMLYTYRNYETYRVNLQVPLSSETVHRPADKDVRRFTFDFGSGYASRVSDDFFGIGNSTVNQGDFKFRTVTRQISTGVTANIDADWSAQLSTQYRNVGVTRPRRGNSIQDNFDTETVPGLYGATIGAAAFAVTRDTRSREDNAYKGGLDEVSVSYNESLRGGAFQYWRYRLDSEHFFWLNNDGRKVIAARALVETNRGEVPFFDMPFLGTNDTLRGFHNFRFRDKSAAAFTLEYRYRLWPKIDGGLFVDEGQVAPQLGDMSLDEFHTGYGFRLFVWPKPTTPISFDFGRSREGWRLYINLNARF